MVIMLRNKFVHSLIYIFSRGLRTYVMCTIVSFNNCNERKTNVMNV